jgi:hypothetical protein
MPFIRRGGQPGHCGCEICERLYTECRQEAGKILAEYHFKDFYEAERLRQFLSEPVVRIYPRPDV